MQRTLAFSLVIATFVTVAPYLPSVLQGELSTPFQQMTAAKKKAKSEVEQSRIGGRLRQYEQALAVYKRLIADGINPDTLVLPTPNDLSTITPYLRGSWQVKVIKDESGDVEEDDQGSEAVFDDIDIGIEDLKDGQRMKMNRFVRVGQCPESLQEYVPGFYKLCKSLVRKNERRNRRPGILNSLIQGRYKKHTSAPQTYQLERLQRARDAQ